MNPVFLSHSPVLSLRPKLDSLIEEGGVKTGFASGQRDVGEKNVKKLRLKH